MTVEVSGETSGRRSYLPGAWFGVFGEHATVLLPPSEKRRVAALWELLDDGADFDEVLDALIATGLRDLPGFVLVSDTDVEGAVTARVVVRGDARVSFETTDGPVEVVAAGAGTWVERTVPGVTSTVLDVSSDGDGDGAAGEPMTVTGGLVRVSRVESPPPVVSTGVDTDPMDLPAAGSEDAATADGGHDDLAPSDRPEDAPADPSELSGQSGWSPAVVAGTAVGAAGVAGAAGALGTHADDERSAGADPDAADQWPYAEAPAPAEPEPEPAPEPLAEGDPAAEASDLPRSEPVDALDPAAPIEHHDEPAAHEPAPADDAVGEPTEMMSFDELAVESEAPSSDDHVEHGAEPGAEHGSFLDKPADEPASGGWAPAEPAPQDGPPPAPDFGSGAAPAGPQWSPPPAPSNPFAAAPPAGGAPDPYGTPDQQQGWDQQGGFEQAAGFEPPQSSPSQESPEQGGWGEPSPGWGEPAAAPSPGWGEPAPAAHDDVDHDGDTRAGDYDPEVYARSQPGIPGQPPAPSVTARPVARLMMSHGETVDVDRAILVGRAPEARRFTATEQPRLVTVPSPNQEISSTHLEVRPGSGADHGSAVVTDMGSTNGTVLIQPGLAPEDLQPGIAVQLIPGAVIDLGDGLTIQVANP